MRRILTDRFFWLSVVLTVILIFRMFQFAHSQGVWQPPTEPEKEFVVVAEQAWW